MRTTAGARGKPSESSGGEGWGRDGTGVGGVRAGRWERRDGGEGGKVGEKRKIGITHEREEERARCFLPSAAKRGDIKKRFTPQTRAQEKRGEGVGGQRKREGKKKSDNNLLFVVTATKLVMKPEPGSSCLSGSGVSGP